MSITTKNKLTPDLLLSAYNIQKSYKLATCHVYAFLSFLKKLSHCLQMKHCLHLDDGDAPCDDDDDVHGLCVDGCYDDDSHESPLCDDGHCDCLPNDGDARSFHVCDDDPSYAVDLSLPCDGDDGGLQQSHGARDELSHDDPYYDGSDVQNLPSDGDSRDACGDHVILPSYDGDDHCGHLLMRHDPFHGDDDDGDDQNPPQGNGPCGDGGRGLHHPCDVTYDGQIPLCDGHDGQSPPCDSDYGDGGQSLPCGDDDQCVDGVSLHSVAVGPCGGGGGWSFPCDRDDRAGGQTPLCDGGGHGLDDDDPCGGDDRSLPCDGGDQCGDDPLSHLLYGADPCGDGGGHDGDVSHPRVCDLCGGDDLSLPCVGYGDLVRSCDLCGDGRDDPNLSCDGGDCCGDGQNYCPCGARDGDPCDGDCCSYLMWNNCPQLPYAGYRDLRLRHHLQQQQQQQLLLDDCDDEPHADDSCGGGHDEPDENFDEDDDPCDCDDDDDPLPCDHDGDGDCGDDGPYGAANLHFQCGAHPEDGLPCHPWYYLLLQTLSH